MIRLALYVGIGGFLGSVGRFLISQLSFKLWSGYAPAGTLLVNILGSFILGALFHFSGKMEKETFLLITTGFCGGFTTFSTFSMENIHLINVGNYSSAFTYIALSLILGLIAGYMGWYIGKTYFL